MDIEYGSQLYADLKRGLESLVLSNHLHLLFLVTPYDRLSVFTPNWNVYMNQVKYTGISIATSVTERPA